MKKSIKPQSIINNERIVERRVIANEFNKYFVSLASKLNEKETPVTNNFGDFLPSGNIQSMFMEDCSGFEINKIISEMQNGKSSDIPISVIKKTSNIISPIIAHHFNYLMGTGKLSPSINITNLW